MLHLTSDQQQQSRKKLRMKILTSIDTRFILAADPKLTVHETFDHIAKACEEFLPSNMRIRKIKALKKDDYYLRTSDNIGDVVDDLDEVYCEVELHGKKKEATHENKNTKTHKQEQGETKNKTHSKAEDNKSSNDKAKETIAEHAKQNKHNKIEEKANTNTNTHQKDGEDSKRMNKRESDDKSSKKGDEGQPDHQKTKAKPDQSSHNNKSKDDHPKKGKEEQQKPKSKFDADKARLLINAAENKEKTDKQSHKRDRSQSIDEKQASEVSSPKLPVKEKKVEHEAPTPKMSMKDKITKGKPVTIEESSSESEE